MRSLNTIHMCIMLQLCSWHSLNELCWAESQSELIIGITAIAIIASRSSWQATKRRLGTDYTHLFVTRTRRQFLSKWMTKTVWALKRSNDSLGRLCVSIWLAPYLAYYDNIFFNLENNASCSTHSRHISRKSPCAGIILSICSISYEDEENCSARGSSNSPQCTANGFVIEGK